MQKLLKKWKRRFKSCMGFKAYQPTAVLMFTSWKKEIIHV